MIITDIIFAGSNTSIKHREHREKTQRSQRINNQYSVFVSSEIPIAPDSYRDGTLCTLWLKKMYYLNSPLFFYSFLYKNYT